MVDYLKLVAEIEAKLAAKSTPPPAEDPIPAPVEPTAPDDDWHSAVPKDTMRRYIEKEQSTWTPDRRAQFVENVKDVMRQAGYREGDACAFILQTAGPVAPARKPDMTEAEKAELHKRMWPTPPGKQEPKSAVPGPDIAKLVSRWPKALRLEFAGRVGKYSNEMPINQAMSRAYAELQSTAKEN